MFELFSTPADIAAHVSAHLIGLIRKQPHAVLGLATGSTMEPIYAAFIAQVQQQEVDIRQIRSFNLDEYIGLPPSHPQSYHYYMQQHLFQALGLGATQVRLPNGVAPDSVAECCQYSAEIAAAGGLDFQLLGIGTNGHIGFNEPGTPFDSLTHAVQLTEKTRIDNGRLFDHPSQVPTHAITMGIQDILNAKQVILVATGTHKAETMRQLFLSPPTPHMPASALKNHGNARIYVDAAAAALLPPEAFAQKRPG